MRRLPVYVLLDTSGSMRGEPIAAVNAGLRSMLATLRQDPHALESVHVGIIAFDRDVRVVTPLTAIDEIQPPTIDSPSSGPTHLGLALRTMMEHARREVRASSAERKGDWAPLLFVMTDGRPSDRQLFEDTIPEVRSFGFGAIVGCVAGPKATEADLVPLCDEVAVLDTMDAAGFAAYFRWVSQAIAGGNRSVGAGPLALPPPPPEIRVV